MNIAIIPAAGLGSRLGSVSPKILIKVNNRYLIEYIIEQIDELFDKIVIVVSPKVLSDYQHEIKSVSNKIHIAVQEHPIGMGDAIFGCHDEWISAHKIVIIWGDQVLVQKETVLETLNQLEHKNTFVVPITEKANPYVQYIYDEFKLRRILQSREGDKLMSIGFCDVGVFGFRSESLIDKWLAYLSFAPKGKITGEINFLPFLVFLSQQGWHFKNYQVKSTWESLGINDKSDLIKAEDILRRGSENG